MRWMMLPGLRSWWIPAGSANRHAGPVRFTCPDGTSVQLEIGGYQFPSYAATGLRDWDANWLNVRGALVLADGTTWSFEEPVLTTWDAARLGAWLRDAAAGQIAPSPPGDDDGMLVFLEPNLGFSVESRIGDRVRVRVHFSHESLPPLLRDAEVRLSVHEYCVPFDVLAWDLASAAEAWLENAAIYPER
jgi:hypothetical protein